MDSDKSYTLGTVREAIRRGDIAYVQKAIDSGFDPNTQDLKQSTPLIFAAEFQRPAIVSLLLAHGADPLHKESCGYDASDVAAWHGEWRMGAYTDESAEIQSILKAHVESPNVGLFAWLKRVFREFSWVELTVWAAGLGLIAIGLCWWRWRASD